MQDKIINKVILEIRAGAGGDEAAIFAGDLARMYQKYAVKRNWKFEIVDFNADETGDYRIEVTYFNRGTEAIDIGFGLAWIRISQVYLPIIMNN